MEGNMAIYEQLREVPAAAQKQFDNGSFKGTEIKPMWRIKRLTEVFGACGTGWYWGKPEFIAREDGGVVTVHCTVALYVKEGGEWSQPIWGVGGNTLKYTTSKGIVKVSDEAYKMAYTDAQSNAAKQIGLGANIWFASDVTKYTRDKDSDKTATIVTGDVYAKLERVMTLQELKSLYNEYPQFQKNADFIAAFSYRKKEIQEGKI